MPKGPSRSACPDQLRCLFVLGDGDLIAHVVAGNTTAFGLLYDRHSDAAYSLAYRMMGQRQDAEDLVQEAFSKVWRGAASCRVGRGSVRTWILSIVRNQGIDQIRSRAHRRRIQDKVEASAPRFQPSEVFAETWRNFRQEQLHEVLKALPPDQLKILELAYFSGYTHAEVAGLLNIPLGTVKGRLRLGMKKIREHLRRSPLKR